MTKKLFIGLLLLLIATVASQEVFSKQEIRKVQSEEILHGAQTQEASEKINWAEQRRSIFATLFLLALIGLHVTRSFRLKGSRLAIHGTAVAGITTFFFYPVAGLLIFSAPGVFWKENPQ